MNLKDRVTRLEQRVGGLIMAYTADWIEIMNESAQPGETRYDFPPAPLADGQPDPEYVYVPEQHHKTRTGWRARQDLREDPLVEAVMMLTGSGPEELT